MNKPAWISAVFVFCLLLGAAHAWAGNEVAAVPVSAAPAAIDKNHLEGWIINIDYRGNNFRLLDGRGFQKRVATKPGTIGDYRIGDKVRVEIDPDYKRARLVEKLYA